MPAPIPDRPPPASQSAGRPARPWPPPAPRLPPRRTGTSYSLTVRDGSVRALVERQITPAC